MQKFVLTFIIIILSHQSFADSGYVSAKLGTWSFATSGISSADESASGFGAYSLEAGYSFFRKTHVVACFNILQSDGFGGQSGFGFDLGMNYFPFTEAGATITQSEEVKVRVIENWRPYVGLFFKQRTFNFILSTTFVGFGINAGVNYSIGRDWFINLEVRYDMLVGPDEGEATQNNILGGVGFEF